MKTPVYRTLVMFGLLSTLNLQPKTAFAQGTAFTYQGQLQNNGSFASGTYNLTFSLYTNGTGGSAVAGPVTNSALSVTNGLFTVLVDFGPGVFNGATNWLEIGVRTNGNGAFTTLSPRQQLTPTPYAIFAEGTSAAGISGTLPAANLGGTYGSPVTFNNGANSFDGTFSGQFFGSTFIGGSFVGDFIGNGSGLTDVWQTGGNSGTTAGVNFLGTTDNQPLEFHVNGLRAFRLEPTTNTGFATSAINVIGGSPANFAGVGALGVTIGGGGAPFYFGTGTENRVLDNFGTIGGGVNNDIDTNAYESTIGGGNANSILPGSFRSTIAGGWGNAIETNANTSVIGGGQNNIIQTNAGWAVIVGGYFNTNAGLVSFIGAGDFNSVQPGSGYSFIGGGYFNTIQNSSGGSVIAGGEFNAIQTNAGSSVIAGGLNNNIYYNSVYGGQGSTIGGGEGNVTAGGGATVGGGFSNQATNDVATVGGGYENIASGYGSTVAGGEDSTASGVGAFVGGGGYDNSTFQGNVAGGNGSTIGGGVGNSIQSGANDSFIGGGFQNAIQTGTSEATIGGGVINTNAGFASGIGGGAENNIVSSQTYGFIGGGFLNQLTGTNRLTAGLAPGGGNAIGGGAGNAILQSASGDFIGSGINNTIQTNTEFSVVDGGEFNTIQANVTNSIILGGVDNQVSASDSIAAGQEAATVNVNSFVWCDGSAFTASIVTNSVTFRASGGYRFFTGNSTAGAQLAANATAWSVLSDRNAKKNIAPVNYETVLDKLAQVPVEQWNYKWEKDGDVPNIGPMAQDFKHAFYPGRDDKSISTLEFDGVELAAIQGLNQKLNEKDAEIQDLKQQNELLAKQLNRLESMVKSLADRK